jgi:hypothetical protein
VLRQSARLADSLPITFCSRADRPLDGRTVRQIPPRGKRRARESLRSAGPRCPTGLGRVLALSFRPRHPLPLSIILSLGLNRSRAPLTHAPPPDHPPPSSLPFHHSLPSTLARGTKGWPKELSRSSPPRHLQVLSILPPSLLKRRGKASITWISLLGIFLEECSWLYVHAMVLLQCPKFGRIWMARFKVMSNGCFHAYSFVLGRSTPCLSL